RDAGELETRTGRHHPDLGVGRGREEEVSAGVQNAQALPAHGDAAEVVRVAGVTKGAPRRPFLLPDVRLSPDPVRSACADPLLPAAMTIPYWSDLLAVAGSVAIVYAYHTFLRLRVQRDPGYTIQAVLNQGRTVWVERMMADSQGILAVQTLRNAIMAATFFASTA